MNVTRMKRLLGLTAWCMAGVWITSCTSGDEAMAVPEASDKVIAWQPVHDGQTRVQLFEPNNTTFYNKEIGGGEFSVNAYFAPDGTKYIGDGRVWYRGDKDEEQKTGVKDWINVDNSGASTDYYWPNVGALNFFAYMPSKKFMDGHTDKKTYVTLDGYDKSKGQQFSCDLPNTNADDANAIEFIYAYAPNQTFANAVAGSDGVKRTPLKFVHPFSLVCFQLGSGSIRMTVKSITLGYIHLQGTFSTEQKSTVEAEGIGSWTPTETTGSTYTATINKRIPNQVNYNTVFGGPFVMMPQDLASVSLTLEFQREDMESGSTDVDSGSTGTDSGSTGETTKTLESLATTSIPKWEPGKRYTYTLMHGDNKEEIYFNVLVEDWIPVDYRNEIDVE